MIISICSVEVTIQNTGLFIILHCYICIYTLRVFCPHALSELTLVFGQRKCWRAPHLSNFLLSPLTPQCGNLTSVRMKRLEGSQTLSLLLRNPKILHLCTAGTEVLLLFPGTAVLGLWALINFELKAHKQNEGEGSESVCKHKTEKQSSGRPPWHLILTPHIITLSCKNDVHWSHWMEN